MYSCRLYTENKLHIVTCLQIFFLFIFFFPGCSRRASLKSVWGGEESGGERRRTVLGVHTLAFEHFILFKCNNTAAKMSSPSVGAPQRFFPLAHFKAICLLCRLLTLSVVIKEARGNLWFNYTALVMQRRPGWLDMLNKK